MTATRPRPRRHGKRAFLILLMLAATAPAQNGDGGWRVTVVPSFPAPALHEPIRGSRTAVLAAARDSGYGELEFATARDDFQSARMAAAKFGGEWMDSVKIAIRRDKNRVIESILITAPDDPLLPRLALAPAFYDRFEPMLGAGFYVVIPDRNTLALYPRLAGGIPAEDTAMLLEIHRLATYPVSREVFRVRRGGLAAEGILED